MKTILERNLSESFTSQWISLREFQSVVFHLRTQPGSNARGSFAVKGSNSSAVAAGLQSDPLYAADPADIATVTSLFSVSDSLSQPANLDARVAAHTAGLPNFVRFDYTRTAGTRGVFALALDAVPAVSSRTRSCTVSRAVALTTTPATKQTFTLPGAGLWRVQIDMVAAADLATNRTITTTVTGVAVSGPVLAFTSLATGGSVASNVWTSAALTISAALDRVPVQYLFVIETSGAASFDIGSAISADSGTIDFYTICQQLS